MDDMQYLRVGTGRMCAIISVLLVVLLLCCVDFNLKKIKKKKKKIGKKKKKKKKKFIVHSSYYCNSVSVSFFIFQHFHSCISSFCMGRSCYSVLECIPGTGTGTHVSVPGIHVLQYVLLEP